MHASLTAERLKCQILHFLTPSSVEKIMGGMSEISEQYLEQSSMFPMHVLDFRYICDYISEPCREL